MEHDRQHAVFVLGAGASSEAGLPLYRDLLSPDYFTALEHWLDELTKRGLISDAGCSTWKRYIEGYLRKECKRFRSASSDFETLLADADTSRRRADHVALLNYYRDTIAFAENLVGHDTTRLFYLRCFARWLEAIQMAGCRVDLVTFNHDLLMERILSERGIPFHYGLEPKEHGWLELGGPGALVIGLDAYPEGAQVGRGVGLYKLHGSNNWTVCDSGHIVYNFAEVFLINKVPGECPKCGRATRPCIVPPQRMKDYKTLGAIWTCASHSLKQARDVVFVGYSLPVYDGQAYELFRRCVATTTRIDLFTRSASPETRMRFGSIPHASIEIHPGQFGAWLERQQLAVQPYLIFEKFPERASAFLRESPEAEERKATGASSGEETEGQKGR